MIGQIDLINHINNLIANGFPRFCVITGNKGQGKKTIASYIAAQLHYPKVVTGIKIDELRDIIELAYKQSEPIVYIIPDADKMSIGAKNSLLKVIEEPPNNAYFIMTLQTIDNTLPTIRSRCQELKMQNYSENELISFINLINPDMPNSDRAVILDICQNHYEIQLLNKYGVTDFYNYTCKVVDNIYKVQSANSFKLAEKLNLKDDTDKYDLHLFLRTFKTICMDRLLDLVDIDDNIEFRNYARSIDTTSDVIRDLSINGINKQSLIDTWILDIRKIWRDS